jgi:hypothetical protein
MIDAKYRTIVSSTQSDGRLSWAECNTRNYTGSSEIVLYVGSLRGKHQRPVLKSHLLLKKRLSLFLSVMAFACLTIKNSAGVSEGKHMRHLKNRHEYSFLCFSLTANEWQSWRRGLYNFATLISKTKFIKE